MAIPEQFIEEIRNRVPLSDVVGRRVKLVRKGRRHTGLCPFHSEKTPSFNVSDDQGFYHCFGCGVSGDAIKFLRETEGLEFVEAVERLAGMAGLDVPRGKPEDPEKTRRRRAALGILEETSLFFQAALKSPGGARALEYLRSRGIGESAISTYRLGYAPRKGLGAALRKLDFSQDDMIEAGVLRRSEQDGSVYDHFRDRIMYPIQDRQGRVIAFGARALGDAQPKYLNSAESPTFSKKQVLYGVSQAREGLRLKLPLVVAEGYMDVIAIQQSGVAAAVAPLGTALTEQQIAMLWKLHDEPVLCFDGDAAGQRAQMRSLELILPQLWPGKSARFAVLPEGKDPDDLLRAEGGDGLKKVIDGAVAPLDSLWENLTRAHDLTKPERRAEFWSAVRGQVRQIAHNQVRQAFLDDVELRIRQMRPERKWQPGARSATPRVKISAKRVPGVIYRHQFMCALLLHHPQIMRDNHDRIERLSSGDAHLDNFRMAIISILSRDQHLDAASLRHHLRELNFDQIMQEFATDKFKARAAFDMARIGSDKASQLLGDTLALLETRSGKSASVSRQSAGPGV